ncbi:WecB/TagA/CpsF family glycosyltransferase [uncultured Polaribacter sp.]|uniref:WecB/TagA/CpsF family glycosyltransferase n=1 Tax=uncultured Polaribacter sp. TaxID=174711 RepID=UPI002625C36B|nr:WecB/TagA/CpsF family glycosyltransferase [uncultured Polaribacter sp.]
MNQIRLHKYTIYNSDLNTILPNKGKTVINTINAHSYIVAKSDLDFKKALEESDVLLPDGEGIVLMVKQLIGKKIKKIAGADIHHKLLEIAEKQSLKCFYLGSSNNTLDLINNKHLKKYKNIEFGFYSPPFKKVFSVEDNKSMIKEVNTFKPDILFVGMTAPKQEKWVQEQKHLLDARVICSIGAVFDFIAETKKRAPQWIINLKFEWLYRSFTELRLTKRYLYSTPLFLIEIFKLKYFKK